MGRLRNLRAKSEEFEFGGETFKIRGLTFPELSEFSEFSEKKDVKGAFAFLLWTTLRNAIPTREKDSELGMSDSELVEEIANLDSKFGVELVNKVLDLSGLQDKKGDNPKN